MGLSEYRRKRNFDVTPEPPATSRDPARAGAEPGLRFVVQKHDASQTHFDLRLQVGDVLKSWAVPKGPSLDPREKRFAVETEDHPLEYADFEGVIPGGQYGAGTMMIWDAGRWAPEGSAVAALKEGMLKFRLEGQRLRGRWMLVRMRTEERQPQWLLIKERDAAANAAVGAETFATSIVSGRTMEEIAAGAPARAGPASAVAPLAEALTGARRAPIFASLKPQLAHAAAQPPAGDEWFHEVKFDGYRLLIFKSGEKIRVLSRRGLDWTAKVERIVEAVREQVPIDVVLDGEAVVLDRRGVSDFQALQNAIHNRRSRAVVFFAFDLPWCDGFDVTRAPLEERRALLAHLIGTSQQGVVRFSEHVVGNGSAALARVDAHGLEGIVCKRRTAPYLQARGTDWLKVKCFNQQEFVIAGFSAPEGAREEFGALLLGLYDEAGALRFAGKVGSGFSAETLRRLGQLLKSRARALPAFANPPTGVDARGVTWTEPTLVAQVRFRDWSNDGVIRHPSFQGLRDDCDPRTVTLGVMIDDADTARLSTDAARASTDKGGAPVEKSESTGAESPEPVRSPRTGTRGPGTAKTGKVRAARTGREVVENASSATPHARADAAAAPPETTLSSVSIPRLTHPERVVFPDRGGGYAVTKQQLAEYYAAAAPLMLAHVARRPLAVLRCPDGEGGKSFFQKHPAKGFPSTVRGVDVPTDGGGTERHLMIDDAAGLLGLVQMSAIEFHPWGTTAPELQHPDRLIFDLDPGADVSWHGLVEGAGMVREALAQVKLNAYVRTTGGKGLHVVVPLTPEQDWERLHAFAKAVAETLARLAPRSFVAHAALERRAGRVYIDYLRNARGASAIASYSVRARPGAPVALPVAWAELPGLSGGNTFNVLSVRERLKSRPVDPWADMLANARPLPG